MADKKTASTVAPIEAELGVKQGLNTHHYTTACDIQLERKWLDNRLKEIEHEARKAESDPRYRLSCRLGAVEELARTLQSIARSYKVMCEQTISQLDVVNELLDQTIALLREHDHNCLSSHHIFDPRDNLCLVCEKCREDIEE